MYKEIIKKDLLAESDIKDLICHIYQAKFNPFISMRVLYTDIVLSTLKENSYLENYLNEECKSILSEIRKEN